MNSIHPTSIVPADKSNFDFEAALTRARDHYRAELQEEQEGRAS